MQSGLRAREGARVLHRKEDTRRNDLSGLPNKPMVPTASTSLTEYTPRSLRRHIGQPLGGRRWLDRVH